MKPARYAFFDDAILERVPEYLIDGFGVEDIAIFLRVPADLVRHEVKALRAADKLAGLYR
jgi:hypothetical protein